MTDLVINGVTIALTDSQWNDLRRSGWLKLSREQWESAFSAYGGAIIRPLRPEHTERTIEKALAVLNDNGGAPDAA